MSISTLSLTLGFNRLLYLKKSKKNVHAHSRYKKICTNATMCSLRTTGSVLNVTCSILLFLGIAKAAGMSDPVGFQNQTPTMKTPPLTLKPALKSPASPQQPSWPQMTKCFLPNPQALFQKQTKEWTYPTASACNLPSPQPKKFPLLPPPAP